MSWNAISEQSIVCPPQGLSGPATRRWLRSGGSRDAWLLVWTSLLKHIHTPGTEAATTVEEKVVSSLPSSASYSSVSIPTNVHGSMQFLVGSRCCGASLMSCAGRTWSRRRVWCSAASRHHSQAEAGVMAHPPVEHAPLRLSWPEARLCLACTGCCPWRLDTAGTSLMVGRDLTPGRAEPLPRSWRQLVCAGGTSSLRTQLRLPRDVHWRAWPLSCPVPGWAPQPTGTRS